MIKKAAPVILLFIFTAIVFAEAQNIPSRPQPPRLVNDFADILNPRQEQALEMKLRSFHDTTSNQITIVTINSLDGYEPSMFAFEIGEQWQVGQKEFDNGVVVLVKPKRGSNDRGQAYIAVGYGLEPAIPDAIGKRIINNEMIPAFQNGNFYIGLNNATNVLMALAAGEISAEGYNKQTISSPLTSFIPIIVIFIVVFLMRSTSRRSTGMGHSSVPFWTALWLGGSMGRSHSGSWNNFSGGGSGFGGGGGGFGGFGGGSFGGGGAGGSW